LCASLRDFRGFFAVTSYLSSLSHSLSGFHTLTRTLLQVLGGTMHEMVWKGEEGDSDDEYSRSTGRSLAGDDDDSDDSDSDDSDSEDSGDEVSDGG
jgi:hypothetical protein